MCVTCVNQSTSPECADANQSDLRTLLVPLENNACYTCRHIFSRTGILRHVSYFRVSKKKFLLKSVVLWNTHKLLSKKVSNRSFSIIPHGGQVHFSVGLYGYDRPFTEQEDEHAILGKFQVLQSRRTFIYVRRTLPVIFPSSAHLQSYS